MLLATEDAQAAAAATEPVRPRADERGRTRGGTGVVVLGRPHGAGRLPPSGRSASSASTTAALAAWLTLTSRLSDRPLGAVVQSSSAAGKSTLADAALSLVPAEAKVAYSAMTGQALYYLGEADLAHKVLVHRRGGGRVARLLPVEAARVRGPPVHRGGGEGPGHRASSSPTPTRWPAPSRCS